MVLRGMQVSLAAVAGPGTPAAVGGRQLLPAAEGSLPTTGQMPGKGKAPPMHTTPANLQTLPRPLPAGAPPALRTCREWADGSHGPWAT